jgi:hypothetical protein
MNSSTKTLAALFTAALLAAPCLLAQAGPAPSGGEGANPPAPGAGKEGDKPEAGKEADLEKKSDADLEKEFTQLAKDVSKSMAKLETEIAKASLPPRKAEELKAELESQAEKLKSGEATTVHPGLKAWMVENPEKTAAALGVTVEELKKLLDDEAALAKSLKEHADGLDKLMNEADTVEAVLRKQLAIELEVKDRIEKQAKLAKSTEENIDGILNIAYEMRARKPPSKGKGDDGKDPEQGKQGEGGKGPPKGSNTPGAEGADTEYQPPPGGKPETEKGNAERKADKDAWEASKAKKEQEDANSSNKADAAPSRYSGMKSKFSKTVTDPKASGTPAPAGNAPAGEPAKS